MGIKEIIPNEKYLIDCWPDGRNGKRYQRIYCGSYIEASAKHDSLMRQHASTRIAGTNPRLIDVQPDFIAYLQANKKKGYQDTWKWALKRFMPHFGMLPVSRITKLLINEYKAKKKDTPVALQQDLNYLRIYVNWMVMEGYAAAPLPFAIEKVDYQKPLPRPVSANEFDAFIQYMTEHSKRARISKRELDHKLALFHLIYESSGMRSKEARNLRWENMNLDEAWVYLGVTKTGEPRFCVISPRTVELLEPYKKSSGYVFVNPRTEQPYGSFKTLIQNFRKETGIPLKGPHAMRHAMGTDTVNATGDIYAAKTILGHADLKSTQIYSKTAIERQRKVVQEVAKYRDGQRRNLSTSNPSTVDGNKSE